MDNAIESLFKEGPNDWKGYQKKLNQSRQNYVNSMQCFADKTHLPVNEKERFESQFREIVRKWQMQGNQGVRGSLTRLLKEKFPDQALENLKINGLTIDQFEMGVYGERKTMPAPSAPPLPRPAPPIRYNPMPKRGVGRLTERQLLLQLLTRVEKMEKEKEREPGDDHK